MRQRGLTAIEVAVVIAIVCAVIVIAWPFLRRATVRRAEMTMVEAYKAGDLAAVRRMLKKGASPDAYSGGTPHHCMRCELARKGDIETMRVILDRDSADGFDERAGIKAFVHKGLLPSAVRARRREIARLMLQYGSPTDGLLEVRIGAERNGLYRGAALHFAVENGDLDLVKELVSHGASTTARDSRSNRPLDIAYQKGMRAFAIYLEPLTGPDAPRQPADLLTRAGR
jgi:prepilin-type N-terminal cleavage/methylation domain-containing protein